MQAPAAIPNVALTPVESSQIAAIGHQDTTLAIQFHGRGGKPGAIYHYPGFSAQEYVAFTRAESLGSHFAQHIKTRTEYYRLPEVA